MFFQNLGAIGAMNHQFYMHIKTLQKNHLLMLILRLTENLILVIFMLEFHIEGVLMEHNLQMEVL